MEPGRRTCDNENGSNMKNLVVSYVHGGRSHDVEVEVPNSDSAEDVQKAEASHYVQTLADNGQLEGPGATHEIVATPDGKKLLRRRRFSAM
jgi:hypothetical protein